MDVDSMMAEGDGARVLELEGLITLHRHVYYNGKAPNGSPVTAVADEVYDAWVDELADLKRSSPAVTAIGAPAPVSEWQKVPHDVPMGSLDKVNTPEELTTWVRTFAPKVDLEPLLVTEKLDG